MSDLSYSFDAGNSQLIWTVKWPDLMLQGHEKTCLRTRVERRAVTGSSAGIACKTRAACPAVGWCEHQISSDTHTVGVAGIAQVWATIASMRRAGSKTASSRATFLQGLCKTCRISSTPCRHTRGLHAGLPRSILPPAACAQWFLSTLLLRGSRLSCRHRLACRRSKERVTSCSMRIRERGR